MEASEFFGTEGLPLPLASEAALNVIELDCPGDSISDATPESAPPPPRLSFRLFCAQTQKDFCPSLQVIIGGGVYGAPVQIGHLLFALCFDISVIRN